MQRSPPKSLCRKVIEEAIRRGLLHEAFGRAVKELSEGSIRSGDINCFDGDLEAWIKWLSWASVTLDERDYLEVAVHALRLAPRLAATDYGRARQRDLGQLWTDTIRGFLGEKAFVKWLEQKFNIQAELDYRRGSLEEFLPSDIKKVKISGVARVPKLKVSIKTTKLRGIWLDVPGAQVEHSDVFVLVRVGVTKEHFVAFLKKISIIREKLLEQAKSLGIITEEEFEEIWDAVPEFTAVPAYIVGFLDKRGVWSELVKTEVLEVDGRIAGRKRRRIVIGRYLGYWQPDDSSIKRRVLDLLSRKLGKQVFSIPEMEFEGIGEFSRARHFIASSGLLRRKREDWEALLQEL